MAPPIIEAVVQLSYENALSAADYRKAAHKSKRRYDNRTTNNMTTANINIETRSVSFTPDEAQDRFSSADEVDIFILQLRSLSWSRLAPYCGWETFKNRVYDDLTVLTSVTGPRRPNRIGMRYINRIDVPESGDVAEYEKYLAIHLALPVDVKTLQGYQWRFEYPVQEEGLLAIVQSATAPPELDGTAAFILDVDIVDTAYTPARLDQLMAQLDKMRKVKNKMFEMSITDLARESFAK